MDSSAKRLKFSYKWNLNMEVHCRLRNYYIVKWLGGNDLRKTGLESAGLPGLDLTL